MVNVGAVVPSPLPEGMELPAMVSLSRQAEALGLDSIWVEDHLVHGDAAVLDIMCVLAASAAATEKIEVGSAVFVPSLRSLSWALKQVATLQLVARGRLQLGVALGGAGEEEYALAGLTRSGQRRRTEDFLSTLAAARRGEAGPSAPFSARALLLGTALPVPPLWVGGTSLAALRRAARFGDGWLSGLQTPAEFKGSLGHLEGLADEEGRPRLRAGLVLHVAVGETGSRHLVAQSALAMESAYGVPAQRAEELAIGGTPEQVADRLARYRDAGADQFCLVSNVLPWSASWPLLAEVRRLLVAG